MIIFRSFHFRVRNVSDKCCTENQNHFIFSNFLFENRVADEIMWKNTVQPDRPQMTSWRMCTACWIPKATNTQTHTHTHTHTHTRRICNIYCCVSIATIAKTCLTVTLYLHCLSCNSLLSS